MAKVGAPKAAYAAAEAASAVDDDDVTGLPANENVVPAATFGGAAEAADVAGDFPTDFEESSFCKGVKVEAGVGVGEVVGALFEAGAGEAGEDDGFERFASMLFRCSLYFFAMELRSTKASCAIASPRAATKEALRPLHSL